MKINYVLDYDGVVKIPNSTDFTPFIQHWKTDFRPLDSETTTFFKDKNWRLISSFVTSLNSLFSISNIFTYQLIENPKYLDDLTEIFLYKIRVRELFEYSFNLHYNRFNDNVSIIDTISYNCKSLIHNPNFYIYIEYTWEGQFDFSFFHKLYYDLNVNKIPADKVIFVSNTQNIIKLHIEYLTDFPKNKKIKFTHFNQCLLGKGIDASEPTNTFLDKEYLISNKKRKKKALILNRRLRFHRLIILSALAADGLLDNTLSSFDLKMQFELNFIELLLEWRKQNKLITDELFVKKICSGFKIINTIKKNTLDYEDLNNVIGLGYETKNLYEDTYFSVVTETLFDENEMFVSEKTYKPILHFHPFVIVGSPHTLNYLKSYGFKTFNKWWDESYDEIENTNDRMLAVYDTIQTLIKKSDEEWLSMYSEMQDILIHNNKVLFYWLNDSNLRNVVEPNLYKIIENEDYTKDIKLF